MRDSESWCGEMTAREKALSKLWTDRCTVTVREAKTDLQTHITDFVPRVLFTDVPCRLSFQTLSAADSGSAAALTQTVKLFLSNAYEVPEGSQITVTRQGKTLTFVRAGLPGVYAYHQEIMLEPAERWA